MKAYIISILLFGFALAEFDENKRYSCYKCDSKAHSLNDTVGDCWTLDGGDYEITKVECHGCYVSNREEKKSNSVEYRVQRECLHKNIKWDMEKLERGESSGCDDLGDGKTECWSVCFSDQCNGHLPGSDASILKLSFCVLFSLIFI